MVREPITYTDYDGMTRTETFYFNLSKSELVELEATTPGGFKAMIDRIAAAKDAPEIIMTFKDIIMRAYGEKSADGRYLHKSKEISTAFTHTPAYDQLFYDLVTHPEKAAEFINKLIPQTETNAAPNSIKA